jgi:hypothetical protein
MARFISNRWHFTEHLPRLNDPAWVPVVNNKWLFLKHFESVVPVPRTMGVLHPIGGRDHRGGALRTGADLEGLIECERLQEGFVLKPVQGRGGFGVKVVRCVESGGGATALVGLNGVRYDLRELVRGAADAGGGLIVQERLTPHAEMAELAPCTINTVRVVTLVDRGSAVLAPIACVRLGARGAMVDNYSQGGICAVVDPATGRIGPGRTKTSRGGSWERRHPEGLRDFVGALVPFWPRVLEICRDAARAIPGLRSVGWDVAVTPTGPVIIEGNHTWGILMMQSGAVGYLSSDVHAALSDLGIAVDGDRLPSLGIRRLLASVRALVAPSDQS